MKIRIPVVKALANALDAWYELDDGTLHYEVWDQESKKQWENNELDWPIVLIEGTSHPGDWHYEESKD